MTFVGNMERLNPLQMLVEMQKGIVSRKEHLITAINRKWHLYSLVSPILKGLSLK